METEVAVVLLLSRSVQLSNQNKTINEIKQNMAFNNFIKSSFL